MSEWLAWLTAWLAATCFHMISKRRTRRPRRTWTRTRTRTGEKQAKRKPRPRPRANRDSKDSLEQEKETGQEKWNPRVQGKGKGKGVTCWLLLRRVKVGPKQKQEPRAKPKIWRVVGVIFNANQRGKRNAFRRAFLFGFLPQRAQTIDLSHWNGCVEWSLSVA